eukprot:Selendium_serpulae@DN5409_c0_g1_i3.p1
MSVDKSWSPEPRRERSRDPSSGKDSRRAESDDKSVNRVGTGSTGSRHRQQEISQRSPRRKTARRSRSNESVSSRPSKSRKDRRQTSDSSPHSDDNCRPDSLRRPSRDDDGDRASRKHRRLSAENNHDDKRRKRRDPPRSEAGPGRDPRVERERPHQTQRSAAATSSRDPPTIASPDVERPMKTKSGRVKYSATVVSTGGTSLTESSQSQASRNVTSSDGRRRSPLSRDENYRRRSESGRQGQERNVTKSGRVKFQAEVVKSEHAVKDEPSDVKEEDWGRRAERKTSSSMVSDENRGKSEKRERDSPQSGDADDRPLEPEKPNFEPSGLLAVETNVQHGVLCKYTVPTEASRADKKWRLYMYKKDAKSENGIIHIYKQGYYLIGKDKRIVDVLLLHESISKQHAVIQYRNVKGASKLADTSVFSKSQRKLPPEIYVVEHYVSCIATQALLNGSGEYKWEFTERREN